MTKYYPNYRSRVLRQLEMKKVQMDPDNKTIKVAILCNMNNNHFALVRYLRDQGYSCDLFLLSNELDIFMPSADTFSDEWKNYTHSLSWGEKDGKKWFSTSRKTVERDLSDYDILIGSGSVPSYLTRIGRTLDIFLPYGSDVFEDTDFKRIKRDWLYVLRCIPVWIQRRGLKQCLIYNSIFYPTLEPIYRKFFPRSTRWYEGIPMIHLPSYQSVSKEELLEKSCHSDVFHLARKSADFVFIYHARHQLGSDSDPSTKNPQNMIDAVAACVRKHTDKKFKVITFEHGCHVEESKARCIQHGLSEVFVWLPKSERKHIMPLLRNCDLVFGQFGSSAPVNGVLSEALASGSPLLTYRDDSNSLGGFSSMYPIYNAKTSEQIADKLDKFIADPEKGKHMGEIGRQWYEEQVVDKAVNKYSNYIEQRAREIGKSPRC